MKVQTSSLRFLNPTDIAERIRRGADEVSLMEDVPANYLKFRLSDATNAIDKISKDCGRQRVVYTISSRDLSGLIPEQMKSLLVTEVDSKGKNRVFHACDGRRVKLSRINYTERKRCIYVGTSKAIRTRLREHFVCNDRYHGPYALHLECWVPKQYSDIELTMYWWKFGKPNEKVDSLAQLVEDGLWDRLLPMLGRRGPK